MAVGRSIPSQAKSLPYASWETGGLPLGPTLKSELWHLYQSYIHIQKRRDGAVMHETQLIHIHVAQKFLPLQ